MQAQPSPKKQSMFAQPRINNDNVGVTEMDEESCEEIQISKQKEQPINSVFLSDQLGHSDFVRESQIDPNSPELKLQKAQTDNSPPEDLHFPQLVGPN